MGRAHRRAGHNVYGRSDREARNNKIISAFRIMDPGTSYEVAATVAHLDFDEDALRYGKIPTTHRAFLLDPRLVNQHFKKGFEQGFNFARALRKIEHEGEECEDIVDDATLGDVVIRNRRHVLGKISSETLRTEIVAMKQILGEEGMRGLRGTKAARAAGPMIYLAQLAVPLPSHEAETDFRDSLEASFAIHGLAEVAFGEVQVSSRTARL